MALKIFNRGNSIAHVSTTSDIPAIKIPINQEYVRPKDQMFFSFVLSTGLFTVTWLDGWKQKEIATGIPRTDFLDGDGNTFATDDAVKDYLANLQGSIAGEYAEEISLGNIPGKSSATLSGHNLSIAIDTEEIITEINGANYPDLLIDTELFLSSSNNSDTENILIPGMTDDYVRVSQTKALTGQTPVALTTDLFRLFSLRNAGSAALLGDVYITTENAHTAGVPDDLTKVLAKIRVGQGSTSTGQFTTAAGEVLIALKFRAFLKKNEAATFTSSVRAFGGVFVKGFLPFPVYQQTFETEILSRPILLEKTDLRFLAKAIDASAEPSYSIDYRLEIVSTQPAEASTFL